MTRVVGKEDSFDKYLPFPLENEPVMISQSKIDPSRTLEQDRLDGRQIPRFAIDYEVSYGVKNGTWTDYEDFSVWKIGFDAPYAKSLSFMFEGFQIPKEAEMYIYSEESRMIQGPITMEAVTKGIFTSDIIERTGKVKIAIVCKDKSKEIALKISKIAQGIQTNFDRAWTDAGDCNYDVNCAIGSAWTLQRDAVGMIAVGMIGLCSGSLINNQCQDLTPNFLTAFHCLGNNPGINMSNWVVRFNYQSASPTCPGNTAGQEPLTATWVTRNGATLRASSTLSDFALLLLNGGLVGNNPIESGLALAGWDRSTTPASSSFCIHHPAADAKKISFDNDAAILRNDGGFNEWMVDDWEFGNTEPGSSGSPLFNQMGRIVG
ncbi:MAG TPA: trypsin-like peptidase domain-containing protein, partial [Saprospiraceae bacterium]|nr:trypsin-like peptidase domain-containing protein [Saprospiraceae bacterium]